MSDRTPVTPVPQAGWSAAAHVTPLNSRSLIIHVEKISCFQQQGWNCSKVPANSQPSHRWREYLEEFSMKNVDMENMEQTGKTWRKKDKVERKAKLEVEQTIQTDC